MPELEMASVSDVYLENFQTTLFLCSDEIKSMHFILSLKNMSNDHLEELVEVMHYCGATTSFNVEDATDYSAIIVDHNELVSLKAPAFTVKYIENSLGKGELQNIAYYRQDLTKHIATNIEPMDVVHHRRLRWSSVLTETDKQWLAKDYTSSVLENIGQPVASSTSVELSDEEKSISDSLEQNGKEPGTMGLTNDQDTDSDSTVDCDLLENCRCDFVLLDEGKPEVDPDTKSTQGLSIVGKPQKEVLVISDTKTEITKGNQISKTTFLGNEVKYGCKVDSQKPKKGCSKSKETTKKSSNSASSSRKWTFLDEFQSESSDSEEDIQPQENGKKKEKTSLDEFQPESSDSEEDIQPQDVGENKEKTSLDEFQPESSDNEEDIQPQDVGENKKKNFFDFEAAKEDLFKPKNDKKHTRMPYSYDEQTQILAYIVKHNEFTRVKGRDLWKTMERRKVCPNRTWQSMKENYLKKIVHRLEAFCILKEEDKKKIKQAIV